MVRRLTCIAAILTLAAACAPQAPADGGGETGQADGDSAAADGRPAPDSFSETAWMARAEDGTRFVTLLDVDGTYRDVRNGDPWQQGAWSFAEGPEGKELCFRPDDENGVERCWVPGRMKGDVMVATGPGEKRIELERVDYKPPETDGDAAAE